MTCSVVARRAPGFIVPYRLLLRAALRSHIKPADSQRIIVLDWDDTLLCTWYLESVIPNVRNENALATADAKLLSDLSELEESAVELVRAASGLGDVYIVTNSAFKWVEFSARVYMPRMQALLANLHIVSARERYSAAYPRRALAWKVAAFQAIASDFPSTVTTHAIVIGDGAHEMSAASEFSHLFDHVKIKTVKLKRHPSCTQLVSELRTVLSKLPWLCRHEKSLAFEFAV